MKVAGIRTMGLFSRAALILLLCSQLMASGAQAQSLGNEDDFRRISQLIEQQNIEVAFEEVKELQAGKSKLSAQSQALMGLIYLELAQPAKAFSFFEKVTFSSTEMDHIAEAGMAKAAKICSWVAIGIFIFTIILVILSVVLYVWASSLATNP